MNQEIKGRIFQIQNGIVPEGYKKTDFGIFPEDWEQKTFGEIFDFCGSLSKSRDELGDNGIPYLHYGDMHRSDFKIASYSKYLHLPKYDMQLKGTEAYLLNDGDVVFLDASEDVTGTTRSVVVDNPGNKPFLAGLHTFVGKEKDEVFDKYYKQYLTLPDYIRKQIMRLAIGFKVYGVNRNEMGKVNCFVPSKPEQKRIADILEKWDKAIELQEQLIEKLTITKQSLMQKLFPKKNSCNPELRFHGFDEDWEQVKLRKIAKTTIGEFVIKTKQNENSPYPVYNGGISYTGFYDEYNNEGNKIIVSARGANAGFVNIVKDRYWAGNSCYSIDITNKERNITDFVYHEMKRNQTRFTYYQQAANIPSVSKADVENFLLDIPCIDEQNRISKLFETLDNIIDLKKEKLELLKQQQKSMQQLLLTGIVRV